MSKKISKIAATGLLGVVTLTSQPSLASNQLLAQDNLTGNSALNQKVNRIDQGLLTVLSSHNKKSPAPWQNGNWFVDGFSNGSWGKTL